MPEFSQILPPDVDVSDYYKDILPLSRLFVRPSQDGLVLSCYGIPDTEERNAALYEYLEIDPSQRKLINDIERDVNLAVHVSQTLFMHGGRLWSDGRIYPIGSEPDSLITEPWTIPPNAINHIYAVVIPKKRGHVSTYFTAEFPFEYGAPRFFSDIGIDIHTIQGKRYAAFLNRCIVEEYGRKSTFRTQGSRETLMRLVLSELTPPQNILIDKSYLNRG